jgi:hypothetical protein
MSLDAVWRIPERFYLPGLTPNQSKKRLESALHARLGGPMNGRAGFPRTGEDWCWAAVPEAVDAISGILGCGPALRNPNYALPTNDNFRNPHPRHLPTHARKIVLWLYRELHTGRLKAQFVDDWRTPFEKARRYSRNGIEEVRAFSYDGPASPAGNMRVFSRWSQLVTQFGFGPDDIHYGWLREGVELADAVSFASLGLADVPVVPGRPPEGVRATYNAPG